MKQIEYTGRAAKDLRKIPVEDKKRIVTAIEELSRFPDVRNVKALSDREGEYRLRIGRYRAIFEVIGTIIVIIRIKKRDERTY